MNKKEAEKILMNFDEVWKRVTDAKSGTAQKLPKLMPKKQSCPGRRFEFRK